MLARVHSAASLGIEARVLDVEVDVSDGLPSFTIVGRTRPLGAAKQRISRRRRGHHRQPRPGRVPEGGRRARPAGRGRVSPDRRPRGVRRRSPRLRRGARPGRAGPTHARRALPRPGRPRRGVRRDRSVRRERRRSLGGGRDPRRRSAVTRGDRRAPAGRALVTVAAAARRASRVGPCRTRRGPRRALEIAAAGGHHVLLSGPPGTGKTMLARRLPTILPSLERSEAIEVTKIHSIAGVLPAGAGLVADPPFRAPHHGISAPGLVGGGVRPGPGEISLAHRGVLFLDELPEFRRDVLEGIRQPLEEKRVCLVRVGGACVFPSDFLLVAAMNPCPCGFAGDARRMCRCSGAERFRYARRVSGPLLDRIDIHVRLAAVPWADLERQRGGETSSVIRERVAAARRTAAQRFPQRPAFRNADLSPSDFDQFLALETPARALLATAVERMRLSVRAVHRALRVARTIADLEMRQTIAPEQLAEAVGYRSRSVESDAPDLDRVPLRPVRSP